MSYCRFSGADAYIYLGYYGIECCGCILAEKTPLENPFVTKLGFSVEYSYEQIGPFETAREMLEHIAEHRAAGHDIPLEVDEAIKADFLDLDASVVETEEERLEREEIERPKREAMLAKMKAAYEASQKED